MDDRTHRPLLGLVLLATISLLVVLLREPPGGQAARGEVSADGSRTGGHGAWDEDELAPVVAGIGRGNRTIDERVDENGLLPNEAWIDVHVRSAPAGLPVANAPLYLVSQRIDRGETDADGNARVKVRAGAVLVGAQVPEGGPFVAMELFDDAVGPTCEAEVEVEAGGELAVELHLQSASSIVGRLIVPNEGPVFEQAAFQLVPQGPRWMEGRRVITDQSGQFDTGPLFAGRYELRPASGGQPLVRPIDVELRLGERRGQDLEVLMLRDVTIHIDAVCETTGDPWPLPFVVDVVRGDVIGRFDDENSWQEAFLGLEEDSRSHTFRMRDGPYSINLSSDGWSSDVSWIAPDWDESRDIVVEPGQKEVRIELKVPDAGPVARYDGQLTAPVGSGGWTLRARYFDLAGAGRTTYIDVEEQAFTLLVDMRHVTSDSIDFVQAKGFDVRALLHTAVLEPGRHALTLTPTAR